MHSTANSESDEIPKTQLILSHLAEQGPKTEYDLYKQLPKLSHGTIHFCLNKLAKDGAITYVQTEQKNKQTKKQYYLTFLGTVTYVASTLYWQTMKLTDSQIDERWKRFDEEEQEEIIEFLYRQGPLLKYSLFEESKWLAAHYPGIGRVFAIIAHIICSRPPEAYKHLLIAAAAGKKQYPSITGQIEEGIPSDRNLIDLLQDAYRREFTSLFFESIALMKHSGKSVTNLKLRRLAEEELEEQKREQNGLELAIQLFGGINKQK